MTFSFVALICEGCIDTQNVEEILMILQCVFWSICMYVDLHVYTLLTTVFSSLVATNFPLRLGSALCISYTGNAWADNDEWLTFLLF